MFKDRKQAGRLLAKKLDAYKFGVVLGIPRGGVVVAKEISKHLNLQLGVLVTKKIGAPFQKELAIGAVGPEGVVVLDRSLIKSLNVNQVYIDSEVRKINKLIVEREERLSAEFKGSDLRGKDVILTDDGIATGATIDAAIKYLRKMKVQRIILAVPVAPRDSIKRFRKKADELVILETPSSFQAVGQFYHNFPQVTDEEVIKLIKMNTY